MSNFDLSNASDSKWYALKVRTRSELLAAQALNLKGFDYYCPSYSNRRQYSDRTKLVTQVLFPGYLFCKFSIRHKVAVIDCPAVEYVLTVNGTASAIPEPEMESLQRVIDRGATPVDWIKTGQRVRVIRGPLTGVEGYFMSTVDGDTLNVSIFILQRSISVSIDRDYVEAI